jgi:hypothetical protein
MPCKRHSCPPFLFYDRTVSFLQNEFTPSQWKDTGVERNVKVEGATNSKILLIFDHVVRNSSTIDSNYHDSGRHLRPLVWHYSAT